MQSRAPMPEPCPPAHQPDTPAVSLDGRRAGLARLNDGGFRVGVLLVPWICSDDDRWLSRLGPRAVTASMLRRSLPFQPTLLAISSSNALPTSPPDGHAGRQPSPADLVGQAVRLRRLPQASPELCKGVAYCSKDCQVCVASHPAGLLPKSLTRSLTHTAPSHHESNHQSVRHPKPETLHPKHQPLHCKPGTPNPKA